MAQIRISILNQTGGTKTVVEVPDDVPMNQLLPALVTSLQLPVLQGGNPISYRLDNTGTGERIAEDASLCEAGIQSGAILSLLPEVTAGGRLA